MNTKNYPYSQPVSWWLFSMVPFAAVMSVVRRPKAANFQNVVWFFTAFYGFTFVSTGQSDSVRYKLQLQNFASNQVAGIADLIELIYQGSTGYVDILQPVLTFIISRFTNDSQILFMAFGFIFGYFYSRNISVLLSFVQTKVKREALPLLIIAAVVVGIWQINGFRFWTAAHIFLYGLLSLAEGRRLKGISICVSTILVHFSFIIPSAALIVYLLLPRWTFVYYLLFFGSFFVAELAPSTVNMNANRVPEIFQDRATRYTSEVYLVKLSKEREKVNWYVGGRIVVMRYLTIALVLLVFLRHRKAVESNNVLLTLLPVGLLIASFNNFAYQIPSIGRFEIVSFLILFSFFFLLVQSTSKRVFPLPIQGLVILGMILYTLVEVRIAFDSMGLVTLLGNPILALFIDNDIPIIQLIK